MAGFYIKNESKCFYISTLCFTFAENYRQIESLFNDNMTKCKSQNQEGGQELSIPQVH